jgi:large subunit ribosomal protein L4
MTAAGALAPVLRGPRRKERPEPVTRTVTRRDVEGNELGTVDLEPEIFGIEPNESVIHQVVTAQLAAARAGTHSTLTRAEVRGGGAKPYRQKGTGRARQGSRTAAQWVGGGKAFGPKPRSYRQKTPKKMVRLALRSALSDRAASERVGLVNRFGWEAPKTKDAAAALTALGLEGRVLVVLHEDDVVADRSFGNLPKVQTVQLGELSAHDVVRNDWVLFTDRTLGAVSGVVIEEDEIEEDEVEAAAAAEAAEAADAVDAETEEPVAADEAVEDEDLATVDADEADEEEEEDAPDA